MDIYVKISLLSVVAIVLLFLLVDSWYKNRYARIVNTNDKTTDPEFTVNSNAEEFFEDQLGPVRIISLDNPTSKFLDKEKNNQDSNSSLDSKQTVTKINSSQTVAAPATAENLLILSVMAKPPARFASYDLLQTISNAGFEFGAMNIFHYYQATLNGKIKLFSLASANKPGSFDIHNMGNFSCAGLMLFINITEIPDPQHAFKLMLETANQLAEDLDGVLHADPLTPWNEKIAWQYQKKLFNLKSR